jgi:uncharacterized ubiquitin-like protein YukD
MIILKPIATAQTLKFIGRFDNADSIILRDEQDNTEVTITADFDLDSYYLSSDIIFDLEEDRFYNLTVYKSLISDYEERVELDDGIIESLECLAEFNTENREIVYKDKIFCTSQDIDDYSINNGDYTQHSSNNDYITV